MQDEARAAMVARIKERIEATGQNEKDVSLAATGTAFAIRNLKRGSTPGVDLFEKLAPVLETTAAWLAYGAGSEAAPVLAPPRPSWPPMQTLPIIGEVAAGQWQTIDQEIDAPFYDDIAVAPSPLYPADHQFGVVVRGTSINRVAPDGSVLACLDLRKARIPPRQRDVVIVEQRRAGGHEIMRTAKRYVEVDGAVELWPDSTDPRWKSPIVVEPGEEDEGVEIEVIGKVTFVYAPIERIDRDADRDQAAGNQKRRS